MDAVSIDNRVSARVRRLEGWEAARGGRGLDAARFSLARRLGVTVGQLENIRRGRIKGVRAHIAAAIEKLWLAEAAREIEGLRHELERAHAAGLGAHAGEIRAAEAALGNLENWGRP